MAMAMGSPLPVRTCLPCLHLLAYFLLVAGIAAASMSSSLSSVPAPLTSPPASARRTGAKTKRQRRRRKQSPGVREENCFDDARLLANSSIAPTSQHVPGRPESTTPPPLTGSIIEDRIDIDETRPGENLNSTLMSDGRLNKRPKRRRRRKSVRTETIGDILQPIDDNVISDHRPGIEMVESFVEDENLLLESKRQFPTNDLLEQEIRAKSLSGAQDPSSSSSVYFSRNETVESLVFPNGRDANESGTSYDYSKHVEEEMFEGEVHTDSSANKTSTSTPNQIGQTPPIAAFIHSSQRYENIHIRSSGGSNAAEPAVSVKISRQRKEQSVHITHNNVGSHAKKESTTLSEHNKPSKPASTATVSARGSGKGGECLRRIKREWKDAAKMGIAYDWVNARTVNEVRRNRGNDYVRIGPYGRNLLRWHFSVSGPAGSPYDGGVYHGRVLLPRDYPGSPPRVQVLTPSGRFQCGVDICLSASSYHPETWTPRWTVLSLVDALRLHMLTTANEIGGVAASDEQRRQYAKESRFWRSPGIVDHRPMIEEGIFPLHCEENEAEEVENSAAESKSGDETDIVPPPKSKKDVGHAGQKSTCESNQQQERVERGTGVGSKTAKVAKSRRRSNVTATAPNDISREQQRGILSTLVKRVIVEILKLPLRILAVVLRVLTRLESKLRAIIDDL